MIARSGSSSPTTAAGASTASRCRTPRPWRRSPLDDHRVNYTEIDRPTRDHRRVSGAIWFLDPEGNRIEIFHGPELADQPFSPGRTMGGFRTGVLGLGHVVLLAADARRMIDFYQQVLGFRLSEYQLKPFEAYFFHLNPRHHGFTIVRFQQCGENADGGGFASTIRAEKAQHGAGAYGDVHTFQRLGFSIAFLQAPGLNGELAVVRMGLIHCHSFVGCSTPGVGWRTMVTDFLWKSTRPTFVAYSG